MRFLFLAVLLTAQSAFADVPCEKLLSSPSQWLERSGYKAYIPSNLKPNAELIVHLHGCRQDFSDVLKATRLNEWAESEGFVVLYPIQSFFSNPLKCWNWFMESQVYRGSSESMRIINYVRQLQTEFKLNQKNTYL